MARIRSIKPEFFTSLTIADLSIPARLTFIGLWTHADDCGRAIDDPRLLKAAIWPLDERTPEDLRRDTEELHDAGLITRYTVRGRRYLTITTWEEHQRVSHPAATRLPGPDEADQPTQPPPTSGNTAPPEENGVPPEASREPPEELASPPETLRPEQGAGSREQGAGKGAGTNQPTTARAREDDRSPPAAKAGWLDHFPTPPPPPTPPTPADRALNAIAHAVAARYGAPTAATLRSATATLTPPIAAALDAGVAPDELVTVLTTGMPPVVGNIAGLIHSRLPRLEPLTARAADPDNSDSWRARNHGARASHADIDHDEAVSAAHHHYPTNPDAQAAFLDAFTNARNPAAGASP